MRSSKSTQTHFQKPRNKREPPAFPFLADFLVRASENQFARKVLLTLPTRLLRRPSYPLKTPTVARVEVTNRCNLSCRMCLHQSLEDIGDMELKTYRRIIDLLPKTVSYVNPTGFGEPLLHEDIVDVIRFARQRHKYTEIYTNATILDKEMAKNLLASGLWSIHFSIDGTTKRTYEGLRRGSKFETVIENISNFMAQRRKAQNPPQVVMRVVIWKNNLHEATRFVELAYNLGIKNVLFQALQHFWNSELNKPEYSIHSEEAIDHSKRVFRSTQEKAQEMGVKLKLPALNFCPKIRCSQPWYLIFINWKGFATPCCAVYDVNVGSILDQSFSHIWWGPKLVSWRSQMKSLWPPTHCRNCGDR